MTSGSRLNAPISCGANRNMAMPTASISSREQSRENRIPFFTRSVFPAPRFWLTKVVTAMEKAVTGRKQKPSTFV